MSQAYSLVRVEVVATRELSPHMRRITFTGPGLANTVSAGLDQRIKLFFPLPGQTDPVVPEGENWYAEYRAMPDAERPFVRTYTIRRFQPETLELDVDIVLHGDSGPGSAWAAAATPGDRVALLAPDAAHTPVVGYEFTPPPDVDWVLLAGDETALPAIASILEALPVGLPVLGFVEVGSREEVLPLASAVTWLSRRDGESLRAAVTGAQFPAGRPYAWVAAESGVATDLRRHLVNERGLDKELVYFSGYWLEGSAIE